MAESAALLVDEILPRKSIRQWVLSLPFALRLLVATNPQALGDVLGINYRVAARLPNELARFGHLTASAVVGTVIGVRRLMESRKRLQFIGSRS